MHRLTVRFVVLVLLETCLIVLAVVCAAYLRLGERGAIALLGTEHGILKSLLIAAVAQTCLYFADLYDFRLVSDRGELFTRLIQAVATASFLLAAIYFWFPALIIGRGD